MTESWDQLLADPIRRSLWRMGWTSLRPLQERAISAIIRGDGDVILSAKTASGKTEAAFLPILSKVTERPVGSVRALYVGPLKALINDQFRRLEELCEYAEIPVHRWHGDVSSDKKRKLTERPGGVLLITPESLESLFINRSAALATIFHSLSFVVIDELHAMLGKERGTQLRSQLYRLDRYTVSPPRIVALSATIGDLAAAAAWMRPEAPESVTIIKDESGDKVIRYRIHGYVRKPVRVEGSDEDELVTPETMFADLYENFHGTKNLLFANSKSTVEELTDKLNEIGRQRGTGEEFLIHHGSLSKEVREEAELRIRGDRPHTIVCSSTLEMGIDIGSVRSVGQVGPCWSVSSLVQRLGRSGRRDDEPHQMRVLIIENPSNDKTTLEQRIHPGLLQAIAITELMLAQWVESPNTAPHDLSTLVQQTLSVIAETGGLSAAAIHDRLIHRGAFRFLSQAQFASFLRGLAEHDLVEQHPDGSLILGLSGERLVKEYEFYAAFMAPPEYRVMNGGRAIGRLSCNCIPNTEDHIILAGRRWQVTSVDHEHEEISVQPARGRKLPFFPPTVGDIAAEIRWQMRQLLQGTAIPAYLDETAVRLLADARREAQAAGLMSSDIVEIGENRILLFPWTGSRELRTLSLLFEHAALAADLQRGEMAFDCCETRESFIAGLDGLIADPPAGAELAKLEKHITARKWDGFVARPLLVEHYAADHLDVKAGLECLRSLRAHLRRD